MAEGTTNLRWGVERRLQFIEFRLFWEGHVNRSDLIDAFGISVPQASTDLNRYIDLAPNNMTYDKSAKAYVRASEFVSVFLEPDAGRYLSQLRSITDGILDVSETWISNTPALGAPPAIARSVNSKTLRTVIAAIRHGDAIEIKYQSLSQPEPKWRWIAPHALGFDGFRWHSRAFCSIDEDFKDFLLSRILDTRGLRPSDVQSASDLDWHRLVTLTIGPHPALTDTQKKVIELDYGMVGGQSKIQVRKALLYYTLKRLGLDTDPSARKPQDQQIVLISSEDHDENH